MAVRLCQRKTPHLNPSSSDRPLGCCICRSRTSFLPPRPPAPVPMHTDTPTPRLSTCTRLQLLDGGEILDAVAGLHSYTEHDAREITTAVLRALQHAHDDAGCVHRDLKPEKLLMSRDPSGAAPLGIGKRVKVAGWGRSKRLPPSGVVPGEFCFGNRGEWMMREKTRAKSETTLRGQGGIYPKNIPVFFF